MHGRVTQFRYGQLERGACGSVQPEQQFLAFAVYGDDMDFRNALQLPSQQGDIRHRRDFDQQPGTGRKELALQGRQVGAAVFETEQLASGRGAAGRIEIDQRGPEILQDPADGSGLQLGAAEDGVVDSQQREIVPHGLAERGIHLIVQDFGCNLGEGPGIHAEAAGQVGDPAASPDELLRDSSLIAGRGRGTALLHVEACGQGQIREDGRPFRHLGLQPLPQVALRLPDDVRKTLPGTHHLQKYGKNPDCCDSSKK